jgi:membrane protease YdiL (CAAX protease family)
VIAMPKPVGWGRGLAAAAVVMVFSQIAFVLGFTLFQAAPSGTQRIPVGVVASVTVGLVTWCALVLSARLLFRRRDRDWSIVGIDVPHRTVRSVLLFFPLAFVVAYVGFAISQLLGLTGTTEIDTEHRTQGFRLLIAFSTVVIAPWTEELAFRGYLYSTLSNRFEFWVGAIVSSLAWAALHLTPGVLIAFTGVGAVLCWLRRRTGSILPGVGLHGAWNALAAGITGAGWWVAGALGILATTIVLALRWIENGRERTA